MNSLKFVGRLIVTLAIVIAAVFVAAGFGATTWKNPGRAMRACAPMSWA